MTGLGGSRAGASPGDPVPVRYRPEDPSQALVADAQNLWAGVWGLGMFGIVPFMVGIAAVPRRSTAQAPAQGRHAPAENLRCERGRRPHGRSRPGRTKPQWRPRRHHSSGCSWRMRSGHLFLVSSFVVGRLFSDQVGHAVAACFTMVAPACVFYGIASGVRNGAWHAGVTTVMAAVVFLLFAVGLWLFT